MTITKKGDKGIRHVRYLLSIRSSARATTPARINEKNRINNTLYSYKRVRIRSNV